MYRFFIGFGLGMMSLLVLAIPLKLYFAGNVPRLLLVARAHSVPLSTVFRRVLTRRHSMLLIRSSALAAAAPDGFQIHPKFLLRFYTFGCAVHNLTGVYTKRLAGCNGSRPTSLTSWASMART